MYLLKNDLVRQFVKFMISSTSGTHVRDLSRPGLMRNKAHLILKTTSLSVQKSDFQETKFTTMFTTKM